MSEDKKTKETLTPNAQAILEELKKSPDALKALAKLAESPDIAKLEQDVEIEKSYIDGRMKFYKEMEDAYNAKFAKMFEDWFNKSWETKTKEADEIMKRAYGMTMDDTMHKGDFIALIRKASLEHADTGKRTPAKEGDKGPEGTLSTNPIDKMFETARKGGLK